MAPMLFIDCYERSGNHTMALFKKRREKNAPPPAPEAELTHQLRQLLQERDRVEILFNATADPDLIDYCILQQNALEARHRGLLRDIRLLKDGISPAQSFDKPAENPSQENTIAQLFPNFFQKA